MTTTIMWSVALVAVLSTVSTSYADMGFGFDPYGTMAGITPYAPYGPFGAFDYGYMGTGGHHGGMDDRNSGEPELLNCYASYLTPDGRAIANEIAVTIEQKQNMMGDKLGHSVGYGVGMEYGMGLGHGSSKSGGGLSARIELVNNVQGGRGFIVFTRTARSDDGCFKDSFGDVMLASSMDDDDDHHQMAMGGYGGFGGYGMLGYGMDLGMVGYGMGFGMGHGKQSMFDKREGEGVISELNITPGALTSAVVDNIGFKDLKQLAGRGVLVCTNIEYDWDWKPICEEPYYSCCNLKYDNKAITLTG